MTPLRIAVAASIGGLLLRICAPVLLFGAVANACMPPTGTPIPSGTATTQPPVASLSTTQWANAATIHTVAVSMKLPARAAAIAIATALQESDLRNLANSNVPASLALPHQGVGADYNSVGLFEQHPLPPDGATLHITAMTNPRAAGERFIATGGYNSFADIAAILRSGLGADAARVPSRRIPTWLLKTLAVGVKPLRELAADAGVRREPAPGKATRMLGWKPRPTQDTILDTARSLLALGKEHGA